MDRARGWCVTINNPTEEDEIAVFGCADSEKIKYGVFGFERGENGTPHIQGFVYFVNAVRLNTVKEFFARCHAERMRGTPLEAATYCKKDGDYWECGTLPDSQETKGAKGKQSIEERWALAKAGKFDQLPPEQIKTYEYIYQKHLVCEDRCDLDNIWIYGQSGVGKSSFVRKTYTTFYSKPMSKWWDGYRGEDVVVLDDFAPEHGKYLGYYLKIWADHYAFNAEVKGGMLKIRPKTIIVTSQYPIEACFEERETIEAVSRRFKTHYMSLNL